MRIRKLEQSEKERTKPLYREVFSEDSEEFVDYYYRVKTKDNEIYIAEADGQICSMLHMNPYRIALNSLPVKHLFYIVAVATKESYRHRGYMASLLKTALTDLYCREHAFTYLMAASEKIYEPFGFRTVFRKNMGASFREEELPVGFRTRIPADSEWEDLSSVILQNMQYNYQLFPIREAEDYRRLREELHCDRGELLLLEKEGYPLNVIPAYPGEEAGVDAPFMIRIVDVRRMLMSVRLKTLTALCFTVTDPLIEENNRCLVLTGTEFSGVTLMDADEKNSEGTLTIEKLTEVLFGVRTPEEISRDADVQMSERMLGELKKLEPISRIYFSDMV